MNLYRLVPTIMMTAGLLLPAAVVAAEAPAKAAPVAAASPLPDPVARVNGVPIAASDLQKAYKALSASQGGNQVPPGKEQEARLFVLNQLIQAELMYQLSQKTPVAESSKKVDDAVARLRGRFKSDEEFRTGLAQQNLSEKELRELIRRNVVIENHVEQTIASKIVVSDQEVREFYDKNPETFSMPEQVRASHILIMVDAKTGEAEKKSRPCQGRSAVEAGQVWG